MSEKPKLDLVIPLFNEEKNVLKLLEMIQGSALPPILGRVVLVNNGSKDNTGNLLKQVQANYPWAYPLHLEQNLNYGGGIFEGLKHTQSPVVGYLPGDLQVSADDVLVVYNALVTSGGALDGTFAKGRRTVRMDGFQTRFVSRVYTFIVNLFLNLKTKDVNGLPKVFSRSLLRALPVKMLPSFVFDAQLLWVAKGQGWKLLEVPVTFHARREGVSSWSGKRVRTYLTAFRQVIEIRLGYHK